MILQARSMLFRLFFRGNSPIYYIRKYSINFLDFIFRKKLRVYIPSESNELIVKKLLPDFSSKGFVVLANDAPDSQHVTDLCKNLKEKYFSIADKETAGEKNFWYKISQDEDLMRHKVVRHFVLNDFFMDFATIYLREKAYLNDVSLLYSVSNNNEPTHSQLWHMDADDSKMVTFFLYCSDVDKGSGPFVVADKNHYKRKILPKWFRKHGMNDITFFDDFCPEVGVTKILGAKGTLLACDTTNAYHYGSRCDTNQRLALTFRFLTYSSLYPPKHNVFKKYYKESS